MKHTQDRAGVAPGRGAQAGPGAALGATFPASDPVARRREGPLPPHAPVSREDRLVARLRDACAMERTLAGWTRGGGGNNTDAGRLGAGLWRHALGSGRRAETIARALGRHGLPGGDGAPGAGGLGPRLGAMLPRPGGAAAQSDARARCAAEQFIVSCYLGLRAAAEAAGDTETASLCDEILRGGPDDPTPPGAGG